MNLVAKEYVASRADGRGVLILSEMTGAASELGEALIVNPNDIPGMAQAPEGRPGDARRGAGAGGCRLMRQRIERYDVVRWAGDFLDALREDRSHLDRNHLTPALRDQIVREFRAAGRRLLLLDYDGTLVPIRPTPEQAAPGPELLETLGRLAGLAEVVVVSGRPRDDPGRWLGGLDVALRRRARGLGPRAGGRLGRAGVLGRRLEARGPRPDGAVRRPAARLPGRGEGVRPWPGTTARPSPTWPRSAPAS